MYFQHLIFVCLLGWSKTTTSYSTKWIKCLHVCVICILFGFMVRSAPICTMVPVCDQANWNEQTTTPTTTRTTKTARTTNKQTNQQKKHMKTWHTSIWEWIIRFSYLLRIYLNEVCFSYPMLRSHLTNCLAQRTQHSRWYYLSITKFNVRCFIISFRLFVCLWMVFVCVAFLVDLSDCLFYCIAWAFCPMPVSCPSVSVYVVAHSMSSQFSYIWLSKADVLYSQQWILSLLYGFPSHGGQYIRW